MAVPIRSISVLDLRLNVDFEMRQSTISPMNVDADDHLIKAADFSLTSVCPMNSRVTARSALRPQAGQIAVGGNTQSTVRLQMV
jgi:hypothetical protein